MSKLLQLLVTASGLGEQDVLSILANAPSRYKTFTIPKRNGGARLISQPAREVKYLQRVFVEEVLSKCPVHDAATAYRVGISIRDNAAIHAAGGAVLKLDFKDFFPSITSHDWRHYCLKNRVLESEEDLILSANLLFTRSRYGSALRLAIGAPSSPMLSNVLMHEFDAQVTDAVSKDKVKYSRYADDLTFSAIRAGNLARVERDLYRILRDIKSPRLRINDEKTVLATRKFRRVVTGLVISDDNAVSLGRGRKREIRAAVHRYTVGGLDMQEIARLSGVLAYVKSVEPDFLLRLTNRFGIAAMDRLRGNLPPPSGVVRQRSSDSG